MTHPLVIDNNGVKYQNNNKGYDLMVQTRNQKTDRQDDFYILNIPIFST